MKRYCYFNGRIMNLNKARVHPYDIGVLRGYGVFDVMRTVNNKPFLIDKHWKRFQNSAKHLKLTIPLNFQEYTKILHKILKLNKFPQAIIRTILTGGVSTDAFSVGRPNFYILVEKYKLPYPLESYKKGVKIITLEFKRTIPTAKVTNYVEAIVHQDLKKKKKASEILYVKNGQVLECSTSNIFLFLNGKLITPKNDVLVGTTRNLVVELARKKYKVVERKVLQKEIKKAQEVFLTAGNKGIIPVVQIDSLKIGNGKVGERTKILMQIFENYMENY